MSTKSDTKNLRSFGLLVGGIFSVIALWPTVFSGEPPRWWAFAVGAALIGLGLVLPAALAPVYRVWMRIGHVLGWINTRIILGVIFYGMVTPMGLIMRVLGKDPMRRVLVQESETYRVARTARPSSHLRRQF